MLGAERFTAMGVHMHVAIAGWVLLVAVGVAHRLLPMFLLSHGSTERLSPVAVWLLAIGTGLLFAGHHAASPLPVLMAAAMIWGGVAAFLGQAAFFFAHRRKPTLDPGLRLAGGGVLFLAASLALAPFFVHHGLGSPRLATAYGLVLVVGAISLFVAGHYYKIVPFLVWYHRFGPLVGRQPVPRVTDLYRARPADVAGALLCVGVAGLATATLLDFERIARPAGLCFLAGASILFIQMWTISLRRPG
jgi:hypothetical protein